MMVDFEFLKGQTVHGYTQNDRGLTLHLTDRDFVTSNYRCSCSETKTSITNFTPGEVLDVSVEETQEYDTKRRIISLKSHEGVTRIEVVMEYLECDSGWEDPTPFITERYEVNLME